MVKKGKFILYSVIFLLVLNSVIYGEIASELNFIVKHNQVELAKERELSTFTFTEINELKTASMGLIRIYQLFISSQDISACTFTPSCSRFGMSAIKKYGVFYGILMTSDRLQRCYGFNRKYYPIHPKTGKCFDPIEPHYLKIKLK